MALILSCKQSSQKTKMKTIWDSKVAAIGTVALLDGVITVGVVLDERLVFVGIMAAVRGSSTVVG